MINTFITSFKLKNAYRVNSIIYSIKGIPLIKRILPDSLYENSGLKALASVISMLWELISTFLGKFLYILVMIYAISNAYETDITYTFLHMFTFLTLIGGLLNTYIFNPTKDKYYAIVIMNINASKYALSNYYYFLLKNLIGFMPFTIIFGLMAKVPIWLCILLPLFVISIKLIVTCKNIYSYKKTGIAVNENMPVKLEWLLIIILLLLTYILPIIGITINKLIFIIIFSISLVLGIISFTKIKSFNDYKKMYKQILTSKNMTIQVKNKNIQKINSINQITYDSDYTSKKHGFAYFHELFVKRHSKILTKAVRNQSIIILSILIVVILLTLFIPEIKEKTNNLMLTFLPYFTFIMYCLNRGTSLTQAMFMNCDHSMLTYKFYKTPKVILGMFKQRLKTLITFNLFPAFIIGLGLTLLLYITGGTDNILNYFVLFTSIISMSIFFSIHYLVMYYLLQPYNVNTELKNTTYSIVQGLTYLVCYYFMQLRLPTIPFGIAIIIFTIIYSSISLVLVYRLAPKTFKIRM